MFKNKTEIVEHLKKEFSFLESDFGFQVFTRNSIDPTIEIEPLDQLYYETKYREVIIQFNQQDEKPVKLSIYIKISYTEPFFSLEDLLTYQGLDNNCKPKENENSIDYIHRITMLFKSQAEGILKDTLLNKEWLNVPVYLYKNQLAELRKQPTRTKWDDQPIELLKKEFSFLETDFGFKPDTVLKLPSAAFNEPIEKLVYFSKTRKVGLFFTHAEKVGWSSFMITVYKANEDKLFGLEDLMKMLGEPKATEAKPHEPPEEYIHRMMLLFKSQAEGILKNTLLGTEWMEVPTPNHLDDL